MLYFQTILIIAAPFMLFWLTGRIGRRFRQKVAGHG